MQIEKVGPKSIKKAINILKSGGVIVYPTETSYGLGCDWQNKRAVQKIFKIKKRPKEKHVAVICAHKAMVARFFDLNKLAQALALRFWPGPLSIILGKTAVRVSSDEVARALSRGINAPIVSTSANISDKGDLYDAKKIKKSFENEKHQPDFILDAGRLPLRKPSTIVRVEGEVEVVRQGKIKL